MANTYTLIASSTVGSGGAADITFSSIPNTYTDLLIKVSARCDVGVESGNSSIQFNASSTSFSRRTVRGSGSAASSTSGSDNYIGDIAVGSTATASTFANAEIYIPNYASSNNKSFSVDTVTENNSTAAWQYLVAGLWSNTNAITSITLSYFVGSWNFVQYSTAYLYGVKSS